MTLKHRGIQRLAYVRISVSEPAFGKAKEFYKDTLGLCESSSNANSATFRCWHDAYAYCLIIESAPRSDLLEIGFQVRDQQDIDAMHDLLSLNSVDFELAAENTALKGLGNSIAFTVPSGPSLRLFAEMELPGYIVGHRSPDWVVPKAQRGTPAPQHLNHIGFTSPDPAQCVDFLLNVLGFYVSEKIVDREDELLSALVFRMSKDIGGQELCIFKGDGVHLHHIAFSKDDASDILTDGALLRADGVDIDALGPVRQPYGNTFSLHFKGPAGIRLELCSGGRVLEAHSDLQPIVWSAEGMMKALSYYDTEVPAEFLEPCF